MAKTIYVSKKGNNDNDGSLNSPFLTISKAAETADKDDTVIVYGGEYRECVSPMNGGTEESRIIYRSAEGEKAVIKGSEIINNWVKIDRGWKVEIDNSFFGEYNPYKTIIEGDWLVKPVERHLHTGMVYKQGDALIEVTDISELEPNTWYTEQNGDKTVIYANFDGVNPNETLTEINVRRCCFYPEKTGVNYITVSGFEMAHAATPWSPPTADQPGLIGTHWSKGWVIENNIIHDSRCCGISVGKEISTGDNPYTTYHRKSGYQYQLETVFKALRAGWTKENIGSHIIRNNIIYDCGQNGIVGNHGGAFSEIYDNHIYNIGDKQEFFGFEIAGIKLHAAIDTHIHHNIIHNCFWGLWLDWEAQGIRLSKNIFFDNIDKDLWIEVSHGPFVVDNNIFGSKKNFTNNAQGGAYINNLFAGSIQNYNILDRSTPYHLPHSTEVVGCANVYGGDNRFYNNIFGGEEQEGWVTGTYYYNGSPTSLEEYIDCVHEGGKRGDIEIFKCKKQPAYINNNCYLDGTKAFDREENKLLSNINSDVKFTIEDGGVWLDITMPNDFTSLECDIIDSQKLGKPRISELSFETANGEPIVIDSDIADKPYTKVAGPIMGMCGGKNKIKVAELLSL